MSNSKKSDKFLKLVGKHQEQKKKEKFHGTLSDYLKIIEKNSDATKLAHKRLYDAMAAHGVTKMKTSDERCNKIFNSEELEPTIIFKVSSSAWRDLLQRL